MVPAGQTPVARPTIEERGRPPRLAQLAAEARGGVRVVARLVVRARDQHDPVRLPRRPRGDLPLNHVEVFDPTTGLTHRIEEIA